MGKMREIGSQEQHHETLTFDVIVVNQSIGLTCKLTPGRATLMQRKNRLAADKCRRKKFSFQQLFETPG